ncbi:tetratricopeptide repeat protein [uncultured Porphyromonas sp.]|uniref:tetratricopeptide repeat protein n=1 Tax=uncultured Porphyromonas sp. TaxID=159274 RepID=UPI00261CB6B9|nr:tetratricopeptide repeat protein [uncultured Porphyromonas sp.]
MGNILTSLAKRLFGSQSSNTSTESTQPPVAATTKTATSQPHTAPTSYTSVALEHIDLPTPPPFGTRTLEDLRTAAEAGEAEAQYLLFDYYSSGHEEGSDRPALEWLVKAVEQGYPHALYTSALIQIQAQEGASVPPKALFYLQAAGERGFSDAYLQLYYLYLEGKGVERSEDTALSYLKKAMEAGSGPAYFIVAKSFLPGGGGPIDYDASYYYAEQAAHLGCYEAVEFIIHLLEENLVSGDHTELLLYWRRQLRPVHDPII